MNGFWKLNITWADDTEEDINAKLEHIKDVLTVVDKYSGFASFSVQYVKLDRPENL